MASLMIVVACHIVFGYLAFGASVESSKNRKLDLSSRTPATKCDVKGDNVTIDCANRKLRVIPKNWNETTCVNLYLQQNSIEVVERRAFSKLPRLTLIDLSRNAIVHIADKAFDGLLVLRVLKLDSNRLHYDSLAVTIFQPISGLRALFLMNQTSLSETTKYPLHLLSQLRQLQNLTIDFVRNGTYIGKHRALELDEQFENATRLRTVKFAPVQGITGAFYLPRNMFRNIPYITTLDLRECRIGQMDMEIMAHFKNLSSLSLAENINLGLDTPTGILKHLSSPLKSIDLERVNDWLYTKKLTQEMTSCFRHLPLEHISLRRNKIIEIDYRNFSENVKELKSLDVGRNDLVANIGNAIRLMWEFLKLKKLVQIDFSNCCDARQNNKIDAFRRNFPDDFATLLGKSMLENHEMSPLNLVQYDVEDRIHRVDVDPLFEVLFPPNLKVINLKGTFRPGDQIPYLLCHRNNLTSVDISHSFFNTWPIRGPPYVCGTNVETLDASYNDLTYIHASRYRTFPNVKNLILRANGLYNMFEDKNTEHEKHFRNLEKLEYLDLSENGFVSEIHEKMFAELTSIKNITMKGNRLYFLKDFVQDSLEVFDFSFNFIPDMNMNISRLPSLKFVNLSYNFIQHFSLNTMRLLEGKTIALDLSTNQFNCSSCESLEFLRWLRNESYIPRTVTLVNTVAYDCFSRDVNPLNRLNVFKDVNLDHLTQRCQTLRWKIVSAVVSLIIALIITVAGLLYRNRWTIKFWILFAARRSRGYRPPEEVSYRHDAFLIYSADDRFWVHDVLRAKLEEEGEFNLCIHYRNFVPGNPIEENIIDAIHNSRHSLMVVSRNFVKSQWCIFEMHMARNMVRVEQKDVLILILLEDIPVQDAPLTLLNLLKTHTYLKWAPEDAVGQEAFWEKLREAIKTNPVVQE